MRRRLAWQVRSVCYPRRMAPSVPRRTVAGFEGSNESRHVHQRRRFQPVTERTAQARAPLPILCQADVDLDVFVERFGDELVGAERLHDAVRASRNAALAA